MTSVSSVTRSVSVAAALALALGGCSAAPARSGSTSTPPSSTAVADASPAIDIDAEMTALEDEFQARIAVSALDTGSGATLEYRADERFGFASTLKAFAAAAFLRLTPADEREQFVTWTQDEVDAAGYSPVTSLHVDSGLPAAALAEAAVRDSDNTAMNLVLDRIGGPAGLDAELSTLGDEVSDVVDGEPGLNTIEPGSAENTTSARAFTGDLAAILETDHLTPDDRSLLVEWMSGNATGDPLIRASAPEGWAVADKSGGAGAIRNDIAIVTPPGRDPIILTVLTEKLDPTQEYENETVSRAAAVVFAAMEATAAE